MTFCVLSIVLVPCVSVICLKNMSDTASQIYEVSNCRLWDSIPFLDTKSLKISIVCGFLAFTRRPRMSQICSIGERSGDRADHGNTVISHVVFLEVIQADTCHMGEGIVFLRYRNGILLEQAHDLSNHNSVK